MSGSLLDSVMSLATPDLVGKAASLLGESESATSKGLTAALPVLLGSVANRAGDADFASSLFRLVSDPANDGSLLGNVMGLLSPGAASSPMMGLGGKLLGSLFGNNVSTLANALGGYAGVKSSSATSMLNFAAPLLLGVLGKAVKSGGLNAASLASLLTGQKASYAAALPSPLSRLETYFAAPTQHAAPAREHHTAYTPPPPEPKSSIWKWLLPLLVGLAALWGLSRCLHKEPAAVEAPAPVVEPAPAPVVEPAPAPVAEAPAPVAEAPAPAAIPSANVYFDVNKSDVPADTSTALAEVVAYLQANAGARASISGYHSPEGDLAKNQELAKNRAKAVKAALAAAGVAEDRLDLDKPLVTTGGDVERESRRVEVRIK
jgi:outer membrane protein OmpA-like peptidoglycan-associated protein